jgi:hypothetical protein
MIAFDTNAPPEYLSTKISVRPSNTNVIISTCLKFGETDSQLIQNALSSYANVDSIVFIF